MAALLGSPGSESLVRRTPPPPYFSKTSTLARISTSVTLTPSPSSAGSIRSNADSEASHNTGSNSQNSNSSTGNSTTSATVNVPSSRYNRRNNPELEKRRIHHCDYPGREYYKWNGWHTILSGALVNVRTWGETLISCWLVDLIIVLIHSEGGCWRDKSIWGRLETVLIHSNSPLMGLEKMLQCLPKKIRLYMRHCLQCLIIHGFPSRVKLVWPRRRVREKERKWKKKRRRNNVRSIKPYRQGALKANFLLREMCWRKIVHAKLCGEEDDDDIRS